MTIYEVTVPRGLAYASQSFLGVSWGQVLGSHGYQDPWMLKSFVYNDTEQLVLSNPWSLIHRQGEMAVYVIFNVIFNTVTGMKKIAICFCCFCYFYLSLHACLGSLLVSSFSFFKPSLTFRPSTCY